MKFGLVPLDEAEGKILAHHIAGPTPYRNGNGGRALRKENFSRLQISPHCAIWGGSRVCGRARTW
jgi:hypothetical protein